MTGQEKLRANAELVIQQLRQASGIENFGYNAESVAWVDGFIERQRIRPDYDQDAINQISQTLGSFLGECVIACYGGEWQEQEGSWAVAFGNSGNAAFPFNKVRKHFVNGAGDSVLSWFETIPVIFAQHLRPDTVPQKKPWWKLF